MAKKLQMNFQQLKERLEKQEEEQKKKFGNKQDEREYNTVLVNGKFEAIIRFLPFKDKTQLPWNVKHHHGFEKNGWFIENCPTTIGEKCPVCEDNSREWKAGNENLARSRARKTSYYSNILVIKDSQNEDNNGKQFIFRYPKVVFNKIQEVMFPEAEIDKDDAVNVFDYYEGMNFKLIIGKKSDYRNYDSCRFTGTKSDLSKDFDVEELDKNLFDLSHIVDPSEYKSYDDLKQRFDIVNGVTSQSFSKMSEEEKTDDQEDDDDLFGEEKTKTPAEKSSSAKAEPKKAASKEEDDDLDDLFGDID